MLPTFSLPDFLSSVLYFIIELNNHSLDFVFCGVIFEPFAVRVVALGEVGDLGPELLEVSGLFLHDGLEL
jgi:hypothetical protein